VNDLPDERALLVKQALDLAEGISATFSPFCEVVVHDLLHPSSAIIAIHNNLSGRSLGDPTTELGFARVEDPDYPAIVANYANTFEDGRPVKSTSIGIRDSTGTYIASICLNIDLSVFGALRSALDSFTSTVEADVPEAPDQLHAWGAEAIRSRVDTFAVARGCSPAQLTRDQRRELVSDLRDAGLLAVRRAMPTLADHLGVSRATVYADAR